jgi:8-oxo-dGTP pyrophosphatase MutT (NUDIX family)
MSRIRPWRELSQEQLADCGIFTVERARAASPVDGSEHDVYRVLSRDWVQIVPVTAAGEIVMVRQYRHGSSSIVLEIPGGIAEPGEAPAAAAARECLEETGYAVDELHPIGDLNPNPAIHRHRLYRFYARGARPAAPIANTATETTEVELVPVAEVRERLRAGRIDHGLVAATLWQFLCEHA